MRSRRLLQCPLAVLVLVAAPAASQPQNEVRLGQTLIAKTGDLAPDADGAAFSGFSGISAAPRRPEVVFRATLTGGLLGAPSSGLFFWSRAGGLVALALQGKVHAGTGCEYASFGSDPHMRGPHIVFQATLDAGACGGSSVGAVLHSTSGGAPALVRLEGQGAVDGGTYLAFRAPRVNPQGDVAFVATVATVLGNFDALFVIPGNAQPAQTPRRVAFQLGPVPEPAGFTIQDFLEWQIFFRGRRAAFEAEISNGSIVQEGLYIEPDPIPGVKTVAVTGDFVTGTFDEIIAFGFLRRINRAGKLVFEASTFDFETSEAKEGVLVGDPQIVLYTGQAAPGTGGGTYTGFNVCFMDDDGNVPFAAGVQGGAVAGGIFVGNEDGSPVQPVVLLGDAAPSTNGGAYGFFISCPNRHENGVLLFSSEVAQGSSERGVFLFVPGQGVVPIALAGDPIPGSGHAIVNFPYGEHLGNGEVFFHADDGAGFEALFAVEYASLVPFVPSVPSLGASGGALLLGALAGLGGAALRRRLHSRIPGA
jgi:hypothetical protein